MSLSIQTGTVPNFTASRDTGWYQVTYPFAFDGSAQVVVFAQIQTRNGGDTPGLRLQNVTNKGFEVRMDELIGSGVTSSTAGNLGTVESDGTHPYAETLGWVAIAT